MEKDDKKKTFSALSLAWELGYSIALPLVIFALLGRWLDGKLATSPWLFLLGIILAVSISSYLVYRKTMEIIKK
jgi:F0F1-type ATP synthase assembly protein I